jgi:hypothetical protein
VYNKTILFYVCLKASVRISLPNSGNHPAPVKKYSEINSGTPCGIWVINLLLLPQAPQTCQEMLESNCYGLDIDMVWISFHDRNHKGPGSLDPSMAVLKWWNLKEVGLHGR